MPAQLALDQADLRRGGAQAAQLGRDGQGEQAGVADQGEPLLHEGSLLVVVRGGSGDLPPHPGREVKKVFVAGSAGLSDQCGGHVSTLGSRRGPPQCRNVTLPVQVLD